MDTSGSPGTVLDWSDEELSSSSSRPNDLGAGDGGGDDGGGDDGGGANGGGANGGGADVDAADDGGDDDGGSDGGNTGASIGGSTTEVASPARLSPPATAGVWPMSCGGQYMSRTCTGG